MNRLRDTFNHFWPGLAAGLLTSLGAAILGAGVGTAAGGFLAASILGGDAGKTVATLTGMEAAQLLFINGADN